MLGFVQILYLSTALLDTHVYIVSDSGEIIKGSLCY